MTNNLRQRFTEVAEGQREAKEKTACRKVCFPLTKAQPFHYERNEKFISLHKERDNFCYFKRRATSVLVFHYTREWKLFAS